MSPKHTHNSSKYNRFNISKEEPLDLNNLNESKNKTNKNNNERSIYLTSGLVVMFLTSCITQIPTAAPTGTKSGYTYSHDTAHNSFRYHHNSHHIFDVVQSHKKKCSMKKQSYRDTKNTKYIKCMFKLTIHLTESKSPKPRVKSFNKIKV